MIRQLSSSLRSIKSLTSKSFLNVKQSRSFKLKNFTQLNSRINSIYKVNIRLIHDVSEAKQEINEIQKWRIDNDMTIIGDGCPEPFLSFKDSNFPKHVLDTFKYLKFNKPTPIQSQGWSLAMSGRDMIASAQTGSGKTLSFILPALQHINKKRKTGNPFALVLAPTRELALQIESDAHHFCRGYKIRTACLHGGQGNRNQQLRQIFDRPELIIATPGRLIDFVEAQALTLKEVDFVVLDEADRMLDMGFEDDVRTIIGMTNPQRQTLLWSATWPKKVQKLAESFLTNPVRIKIGNDEFSPNKNVKQEFIFCERNNKLDHLKSVFEQYNITNSKQKVLVFTDTKIQADIVHHHLSTSGYSVSAIHGDKSQYQRNSTLEGFRKNRIQILVATDVAARGLDIPDVKLVVNYSLPKTSDYYIHRIGRTGRAGKSGVAVSLFVKELDSPLAPELVKMLKDSEQEVPEELQRLAVIPNQPVSEYKRKPSKNSKFNSFKESRRRPPSYSGSFERRRGSYSGNMYEDSVSDYTRKSSRGFKSEDFNREKRRSQRESAWDFDF